MAQNARRRTSKWDVIAETHILTETRQDMGLLTKPDDSCDGKDSNTDWNYSKFGNQQFSKCTELEDERTDKDCLERPRSPYQIDGETSNREGPKMSSCEPMSGIQSTMIDCDARRQTNLGGTASGQTHKRSMSPGPDTRRRRSCSISPRTGRSRSDRSRSGSKSPNRSLSRSQSWSRSRSRSGSWSRSRSRSRSPSYGSKRGSERWAGRGRMVVGGSAAPCRDFAAGRCRRGSQCRFLHEASRRPHDRYFDSRRDSVENRFDRGRYLQRDSRENVTEMWERRGYPRDKLANRHGSHHDGSWEKPELHRSNRSTERCYDFTKGRCHRGSTCRYVHHDASSDGGRCMQDDNREGKHDKREVDRTLGQRLERQRASDTPCKFFAEGCCSRGDQCRFSHQGAQHGNSEGRQPDDMDGFNHTDNCSWSGPKLDGQTAAMVGPNSSQWMAQDGGARVAAHQLIDGDRSVQEPQQPQFRNSEDSQHQISPQQAHQSVPPSQEQNTSQEASEQHEHGIRGGTSQAGGSSVINSARTQAEMKLANKVPSLAPIPGQNLGQNAQNQYIVPLPPHAQGFTPNQIRQAFPLPSSGQMQQAIYSQPPNWQGQILGLPVPSTSQNVNMSMQPLLPPAPNRQSQQNYNLGGQLEQSLPHFGQSQQMFTLGGQTQQTVPFDGQSQQTLNAAVGQIQQSHVPQSGQDQQNFNPGGQIQHGVPSHNGQNLQNSNISSQSQQSLPPPQNGQSQQMVQSLTPNGPNQPVPQKFSQPQNVNADEQNHQTGVVKPPKVASVSTIAQKMITSEQAAQITNLSASLAQFFANGPQLPQLYTSVNPLAAAGMAPQQPLLNPNSERPTAPEVAPLDQPNLGSVTQPQPDTGSDSTEPPGFSSTLVEQKGHKTEEAKVTTKSFVPSITGGSNYGSPIRNGDLEERLPDGTTEAQQLELDGDTESKVNETETGQSKKEQTAQSEDVDADTRTDGESKRSKDAKGIRMFKSVLVEFVKDILKPTWKEGRMSKEAHKTVVKKVVEKVTSAMQGPNIPQTPEKIDLYLSYSKAKLTKLVQAYVEKYVKS